MEISIPMSVFTPTPQKKLNSLPRGATLRFSLSGIPIYNSGVQDMAARKREGKEHRQLQNVKCFTQIQ